MNAFATVEELAALSGRVLSSEETDRAAMMLPLVSDALRYEAVKAGRDLDAMIAADTTGAYANVVKLVTVDVTIRAMRQPTEGAPLSQESQTALGYTWQGTYAVPGGGIASAIMRNDLKRLGLKRQQIRGIEMYGTD